MLALALAAGPAAGQLDKRVEWPATVAPVVEGTEVAEASAAPLFTSGDAWLAAGFVVGTLAMAPLDLALAQALEDSTLRVRGDLRSVAAAVRWLAFPGTAIIGGSMYLGGRLGDIPDMADIGLHGSEAVVVSYAFVLAGKTLLGRARPSVEADRPFDFEFGRGLRGADYRSFPSGHTAGAFAVAAAVTAEMRERWPEWTPYVAGVLYTGAVGVGTSRLYHNVHWASDAVAGAAIGTFSGLKVVRYHHDNPDNVLDRWLLPKAVVPTAAGPMLVWDIPLIWTTGS